MAEKKKVRKSSAPQARRDRNKAINQQLLREKMAAGGHLSRLGVLSRRLGTISGKVAKRRFMNQDERGAVALEVSVLNAEANLHLKQINKYLPDLRASETNDEGDNPLADAIKSWAEALDK